IERLAALPTEIEMPYNSVVKSYIDLYTQRRKQLVENMLGMSLYYMPIFEQALDRHGLPLELKYLPVIESALNPTAVSKAGATGLWQFMIPTATGLGLEVSTLVDERRDPYASSEAAAVYLKQLHDMFGDWSLAIAAYNCGPGNINKALRRAGGGKKDFWEIYPLLPAETRGYLPAFIAANYIMNYYDKHNISPALARKPIITDSIHVTKRVNFSQIADVLDISIDEIRELNPQYRKDVIPGNLKASSLVLPSLQVYAYIANEDSILNHNASRYARRNVVEPADGITLTGTDAHGEYIEEQTIEYHTVGRNENLSSIAKKYGVTVSSIRQNNKIGKSVRKGQRLKIVITKRQYKESEHESDSIAIQVQSPVNPTDTTAIINDNEAATAAKPDSVNTSKPEPAKEEKANNTQKTQQKVNQQKSTQPKAQQQTSKQQKTNQSRPSTYTIANGDTLYKMSLIHNCEPTSRSGIG
ncbi:MAG: transglycosylase SLT domain-containing protein, partial [Muribaculaceae bacterium]|nr:transglycosylase SLT domain-containing protein [Muribaculaceae bacterium]